ncbi:hypothetical protein LOZ12_000605 [Ophidiomyces ophidiicola]|uniref:Uncharacterized protein n=1 Tax=Ophidiomyces ophidiicola TaxID=1387563 RepID=A0ACB8V1V9_9EURO|nr:hypothetical protein LOZ64_001341 [Ophidiomyces ophidiicola]KAI1942255.1 hypothetical protein LOZ62_004635 [Ophidiomyces ophidiicola]KAI2011070.1 hypothetical protein LOZ50_000865 [Ophidiomyces ophidiicola]KAI2031351.1 hypothetical protein LOZ45_001414 [Ophidiomyces ophidiicola]KAI2041032.1 hypothetical protein LOZ47_000796 [Ophidiomyces ophidiicola]
MASWDHRVGNRRVITNQHLIPYVDAEKAPPETAAALRTLPFERNIFKLLANSPCTFIPFMKLLSSCWSENTSIRASEWQLIVLRTASLLDAPYEYDVNEPVAKILGFDTEAKLAAIRAGDLSNREWFTKRHQLVGRMVEQLVQQQKVDESTMIEAREMLGNAAALEVLMIHGVYGLLARLMNSLKIDFDPEIPGLEDMLRKYNENAIEKERQLAAQDA